MRGKTGLVLGRERQSGRAGVKPAEGDVVIIDVGLHGRNLVSVLVSRRVQGNRQGLGIAEDEPCFKRLNGKAWPPRCGCVTSHGKQTSGGAPACLFRGTLPLRTCLGAPVQEPPTISGTFGRVYHKGG